MVLLKENIQWVESESIEKIKKKRWKGVAKLIEAGTILVLKYHGDDSYNSK